MPDQATRPATCVALIGAAETFRHEFRHQTRMALPPRPRHCDRSRYLASFPQKAVPVTQARTYSTHAGFSRRPPPPKGTYLGLDIFICPPLAEDIVYKNFFLQLTLKNNLILQRNFITTQMPQRLKQSACKTGNTFILLL